MKKYLLLIITCVFLFPILVLAEECKNDDIVVSKIELNEVGGNAEETSDPNSANNQINLNTKMNVIGDSLTYKVVIKNTSNSDYVFDKNQITKDYINYDISYEDNSNIVKSGEEKTIYLRLRYDSKPQVDNLSNGILQETNQVSFNLINEKGDSLINPETGNKIFFIILIIILIIIPFFIKSNKKIATMVIISLILIPQIVKAVCTCSLDINLNLEIDAKEAVFLPGQEVNVKMKQLAGDDTSTATNAYSFQDQLITSIKCSETEPSDTNKEEKNIVSTAESPYPIYMWFDNGTIYWWSEDKTPSLNKDASLLFFEITNLNDISGVQHFDSSNAETFLYLFGDCNISSVRDLSLWNVNKVHNFIAVFRKNYSLESLDGIENWNVSNASNMTGLFADCTSLTDISSITKWDTSKVINMSSLFVSCPLLADLNGVANWNVSNVISMAGIFGYCTSLSNLTPLKSWDVSNVTNMSSIFKECLSLESLDGLEDWNVSNVSSFNYMFDGTTNLEETNYINNWDIQKEASFKDMFKKSLNHPNFSKVNGTWANGTFTPTE